MGCCCSAPSGARQYRLPPMQEGLGEEHNDRIRYFGKFRSGSGVQVPDDVYGLPSCHIISNLVEDPTQPLYEAEIDQGYAWRSYRIVYPILFVFSAPFAVLLVTLKTLLFDHVLNCDEACQWVRKEYSTRRFFRVYPNGIVFNSPKCRIFGMLGCGSWNGDQVLMHPFDRGAFGFRRVSAGVIGYNCFLWPCFGWSLARQRCQCNGPLWHGGWWCDEWPCDMCFCSYRYTGLADADEAAFASNIALQAYFEQRSITKADMDRCIEYWHDNISERTDPEKRKREVCCEPCTFPAPDGTFLYRQCCHRERGFPFAEDDPRNTAEAREVYDKYNERAKKQNEAYATYWGPVKKSTICRVCGCRRACGRKGFFFCTEGCNDCCHVCKKGNKDLPLPFEHRDIDDENDAATILRKVLGDPPSNVVYRRWEYDEERNENVFVTYPKTETLART